MVSSLEEIVSITGIISSLQFKDLIAIILTTILAIIIIRVIIYREINKINEELKKLDEKIQIYQRLAKIEEKVGI